MILATAIILIILLILICILVVPFNIFLMLNVKGRKIEGNFRLTWMKIRLFKKEFPEDKVKKKKVKKEDKKQKFDIKSLPRIISLLYQSLPHFKRIFKAFLKSTTFQKFNLKLKLGLGSPYDTVVVSGYLYSIIALMNIIPKVSLSLEPDFQNARLEVLVDLNIKIRLFWIVLELLRAFTKKSVRSLLNEFRKMR